VKHTPLFLAVLPDQEPQLQRALVALLKQDSERLCLWFTLVNIKHHLDVAEETAAATWLIKDLEQRYEHLMQVFLQQIPTKAPLRFCCGRYLKEWLDGQVASVLQLPSLPRVDSVSNISGRTTR
jgi:hypothetical protein